MTLVPRSLASGGFPGLVFKEIGDAPVRSVVGGVWLQNDEPALYAWHRTVLEEVRPS